ncbi:MAG: adenylyl-sulfate kinase, partial [Pirellulaceae bacterium]|nr:adenylyl-sulfate kinase [Pirellulaceae bacterium]
VHLHAPMEVCRERDQEGRYAQADSGEISNFPGVSADYDVPSDPDLSLATDQFSVVECVDQIIALLEARQLLV